MCESSDDFTTEQMSDFYAYVFKTIFYIFAAVTAILEIRRRKDGCYMKLIYAIIRYDNEDDVTTSLTKHKFSVTRLSTTGGFLKKGNTTLMIVTEPERVDEAIDIIKKEVRPSPEDHHQYAICIRFLYGPLCNNADVCRCGRSNDLRCGC